MLQALNQLFQAQKLSQIESSQPFFIVPWKRHFQEESLLTVNIYIYLIPANSCVYTSGRVTSAYQLGSHTIQPKKKIF